MKNVASFKTPRASQRTRKNVLSDGGGSGGSAHFNEGSISGSQQSGAAASEKSIWSWTPRRPTAAGGGKWARGSGGTASQPNSPGRSPAEPSPFAAPAVSTVPEVGLGSVESASLSSHRV